MRKKILVTFVILFCLFMSPMVVNAKTTTKECSYRIEAGMSNNSFQQGNLDCSLKWDDGFFGGFSYSCKFTRDMTGDGYSNITILLVNATKDYNTGFTLSDWFEDNKECPRYMVMDTSILDKNSARSRYSVFAANTMKQVNKIIDVGPNVVRTYVSADAANKSNFSYFVEKSIKQEEAANDPNSEAAKDCQNKKQTLDNAIALLQGNRNKLIEMNCQNYELSDDERDTVASADNIKWGRECKQITDNYSITVSSARSELNNYVQAGCLDKSSDEYKKYEDTIGGLEQEVEQIADNIDEQNGVYDDEWEELGEDIGSGDFGNLPECPDIINMEEGHFGWILNTILNYIKIIGPILVVLLSSIDFIKAVVGFDEKAMKEAQNKLIIRLVAALGLFLVPTLVQLLLSFINVTTCTLG